ncbi:DUF779 domain-containing protein [Sanguibacter hominis ATCC BAA-789]|uniref:DUF779 domain-containing protein n=1 Tax=Sanguibacter hominis ATCC BAA-789 TaxID=1312740 RepID=A0A9X5FEE2_9MICO|nr:DUF779 domain-containing protein [Sanguibacter hominis]NKX92401.1 DUF779 domain-containing protein [Sanguibacter hominis ATCC BAA-789]
MPIDAQVVIPGETQSRVALTDGALALLRMLWDKHGPLMFHQSGGCCDGSSPMCYPAGDFLTSDADVLLGTFDIAEEGAARQAVDFWMSAEQFEYWSHTHLTVDAVPGRGAGFSVEAPEGKRFLIRSRLMDMTAEAPGVRDMPDQT